MIDFILSHGRYGRLLTLLACCVTPSQQEPLPLVISVDLSRYYTRLLWKPRTALAVAYLLHEPDVQVLAVTTGFSSVGFFSRWFAAHPCQAAEKFLLEMGKAEVPVVCGSKTGFLERDKVDAVLAKLTEGGAHWLVLDSWAAAAAMTLPSNSFQKQILSFSLPGPGVLYQGNGLSHPLTRSFQDESMSAPGLLLRSWQDSFQEAARLRILGLALGWRKDTLQGSGISRCRGSWMQREFERGRIWNVAHGHAIQVLHRLGRIGAVVEGLLQFLLPQDDHALLLAAVTASNNFTMCSKFHAVQGDDQQAILEECRSAFVEDPPDTVYARVNMVFDGSKLLERVVDRMCHVKERSDASA